METRASDQMIVDGAQHWKSIAGRHNTAREEAERRERATALDRDAWKRRAEAAEAILRSLNLIRLTPKDTSNGQ